MTPARRRLPNRRVERSLFEGGALTVAGVDEVGRGAWAGPLSVGVAVFDERALRRLPSGVADSKLLSPIQREALFAPLQRAVLAYAIGHVGPKECDELGMTAAQRLATSRAFAQLSEPVDQVIVDGNWDFSGHTAATMLVGADRRCVSVAAASVLAKVTRDAIMRELAPSYPAYGFERNKGYPSPEHKDALARYGLTDLHRSSWAFTTWALGEEEAAGMEEAEQL